MGKADDERSTKIISLPAKWLSLPEKSLAFEALFTKEEKTALLKFRQRNQKLLEKAKVIIVDLRKPEGFLGDTICDSYTTEALIRRYPQKLILNWSRYPELFGRHGFVTGWGQEKNKIVLHFQKGLEGTEKKEIFKLEEIIKILPAFNSVSPICPFNEEPKEKISFHEIPLHRKHRAQILWEVLYDIHQLSSPSHSSIGLSKKDQQAAKKVFSEFKVAKDKLQVIIHPDAHSLHFKEKKWPAAKWVELIKKLTDNNVQVFLTTGVNHPEVSQEIAEICRAQTIPLIQLPTLALAQYAALLQCFPSKKTVLVGLESMAGTHLAPALGFKSVVIAAGKLFNPAIYGPFGGTVIHNEENTAASVSVEKVVEAIGKRLV